MEKPTEMHIKIFTTEIVSKGHWLMKSLSDNDMTIVKTASEIVTY